MSHSSVVPSSKARPLTAPSPRTAVVAVSRCDVHAHAFELPSEQAARAARRAAPPSGASQVHDVDFDAEFEQPARRLEAEQAAADDRRPARAARVAQ